VGLPAQRGREIAVAKKQESSARKTKAAPKGALKPSKVANKQVPVPEMTEDNKRTSGAGPTITRGLSAEEIGKTAGDIWVVLSSRGEQTMAGLKKSVDAPDDLVVLALGWLAREDKVSFETNGRATKISLK
jgi:hypothetical protein